MQPVRIAPVLLLLAAGLVSGRADDPSFKVDLSKVSALQGKSYNLQEASGFTGTAPGFDKAYGGFQGKGGSGWIDRRADVGGRDIYAPDVRMDKAFAVPQTSLFQGNSSFSDKTAPFAASDSAGLPMDAPMEHFGGEVPFAGKSYGGPESDKLRQALDRLFDKGGSQTADPLHPVKDDALHKQLNTAGGRISPIVTVEDVKVLINKDIAPLPAGAMPPPSSPASVQGVTVK